MNEKNNIVFVDKLRRAILNIISTLFWMYTITQLFFISIDYKILVNFAPNYEWILSFKIFAILIFLALSVLLIGKTRTLLAAAYIAFFPLIVIFIKLPYFVWQQKSWIVAFSILNGVVSIFAAFTRNVFTTTIYASTFIVVAFNTSKTLNLVSIICAFSYISYSFVWSFIGVFRTTPVFRIYKRVLETIKNNSDTQLALSEEMKVPTSTLSAEKLEKWRNRLHTSMLYNRVYLFLATKLRDYQNSGMSIITEIFSTICLFIFTIFAFTVVNKGLYNIDHNNFVVTTNNGFFQFFYYSFNTFVFNSVSEVTVHSPLSQGVSITEKFFALMLIAIFASVLISVRSQRSSKEVNELIDFLSKESKQREIAIRRDYKVSLREAMMELERWRAGTTNLLIFFSDELDTNVGENTLDDELS